VHGPECERDGEVGLGCEERKERRQQGRDRDDPPDPARALAVTRSRPARLAQPAREAISAVTTTETSPIVIAGWALFMSTVRSTPRSSVAIPHARTATATARSTVMARRGRMLAVVRLVVTGVMTSLQNELHGVCSC